MQTLILSALLIHSLATVAIVIGAALASCLPSRQDNTTDRLLSQ